MGGSKGNDRAGAGAEGIVVRVNGVEDDALGDGVDAGIPGPPATAM